MPERRKSKDDQQVPLQRLIAHVNRKDWWHVPPSTPNAYAERGKFLASNFREAEFWGRPLNEPLNVKIERPLVGDDDAIERTLFSKRLSRDDMGVEKRWALDARMKRAALAKNYDSIILMTPKAFAEFKRTGKLPRSLELNILID